MCRTMPSSTDAFSAFAQHPAWSLRVLTLSDCYTLSDDALGQIAKGCPELREINMSFCSGVY